MVHNDLPLVLLLAWSVAACSPPAASPVETASPGAPAPAASATPAPRPPTAPAIAARLVPLAFESLGVPAGYHPVASHSGLWDLQRWHDRLYLAHGDWYENTGPVRLLYLDLKSGEVVHDEGFVADEEALEIFRVYDDTLYAPGIDATEGWEFGNLYLKPWGQPWLKRRTIPSAVHVWDAARLGEALVAVGRVAVDGGDSGAVWASTDGGESWQQGPDFRTAGLGAATSLFVLGGRAYATTVGTGCLAFDGRDWEEQDCVPSSPFEPAAHVHKNALFEGIVAMAPYRCVDDPRLYFFDGARRWTVDFGQPVRDVVSADGGLFVLTGLPSGEGSLFYAATLACRCEEDFVRRVGLDMTQGGAPVEEGEVPVCPLGRTPHSLEWVAGRFYVGLADGRLFRSEPFQP